MNRIFIFAIVLFNIVLFSAKSFALHAIEVPKGKVGDDKLQIHSRLFLDNFVDDEYQSTDSRDEHKNAGARVDLVSHILYDKNWFAYFNYRIQEAPNQSSEVARRNSAADGVGNQGYENHFGVARELYAGYENDKIKVYGGKFRLAFGRSWLLGRGIWTQEVSLNYMQLERLGAGAIFKTGDEKTIGAYKFGFAAYTKDTKNLDNSQFVVRDGADKTLGNAGEGRSFDSYTGNMDINYDFGGGEKLFYRFAFTNLAVNSNQALNRLAANKIEDEKGVSATMLYDYPFAKNFALSSLIEYADIRNVNGDSDISDQYLNGSFIAKLYKNWNVTLGYAKRRNIHEGENGFDQNFSEISTGYSFDKSLLFDKLQIQIGHKTSRVNSKVAVDKRNNYGLLIRYIKWF